MAEAAAARREGTTTSPCSSPSRKGRQLLLDPIRRWNSFHNSRDRKCQRQALPYLQTLEQFRRQHVAVKQQQGGRSSDVFASICAEVARDPSYMPMVPQGSESLEKASRVLGTNIASELIALSLANLKEAASRSPTRKQFSSPNLIDPTKNSPRSRRTSSDSYPMDFSGERYSTAKQIAKTFSTSNPEDLPNQNICMSVPKLSVNEPPATDPLRKTSSSSTVSSASSKSVPRVIALRTESTTELLTASPLSSSLPSDVDLTPPSAPHLPRRRFSVW